jgi:hypothetical protein
MLFQFNAGFQTEHMAVYAVWFKCYEASGQGENEANDCGARGVYHEYRSRCKLILMVSIAAVVYECDGNSEDDWCSAKARTKRIFLPPTCTRSVQQRWVTQPRGGHLVVTHQPNRRPNGGAVVIIKHKAVACGRTFVLARPRLTNHTSQWAPQQRPNCPALRRLRFTCLARRREPWRATVPYEGGTPGHEYYSN